MKSFFDDTIAAPATIPGTGAISIVRVSGPDTFSIVDKIIKFKNGSAEKSETSVIKYGIIHDCEGNILDEVLVSIFRKPFSYTGEDMAEISTHASSYIVSSLMQILISYKVRIAAPGEFTKRAFVNGKLDLAQAEAVADLIASESKASHRVAINQLRGGFSDELKILRQKMMDIASLMELELDFSEEDVEFADRKELNILLQNVKSRVSSLAESFKAGNVIKNGISVAIVGAPNAGKSTLLNTILNEERAIVSDIAGTTRDTIEETKYIDGLCYRFIDTAGIRQSEDTIEKIGITKTYDKIEKADVVVVIIDCGDNDALEMVEEICERTNNSSSKVIFCINKCDVYSERKIAATIGKIKGAIQLHSIVSENVKSPISDIIAISAKDKKSVECLLKIITDYTAKEFTSESHTLVTNVRHYNELQEIYRCLSNVENGVRDNISTELLTRDLRDGIDHLGAIVGEITTDDILGNLFNTFCIGK